MRRWWRAWAAEESGQIVAGKANVLIFPDIQGEISDISWCSVWRAPRRSGRSVQGLAKPVNDLSRGCSVSDIVSRGGLTAVQAQQAEYVI